jgi:hypothetical protein
LKQFDIFTLKEDLNPLIKAGMVGVILEIYNPAIIEVEFVTADGNNYEYNGQRTFTIKTNIIELIKQ